MTGATGGFVPGDVWRGAMTNCHQDELHYQRKFRYLPVEMSIDAVDRETKEITATFTMHLDHTSYRLKGSYDERVRRLHLKADPEGGTVQKSWKPCDAEAFMSPDFSTLAGMPICHDDELGHGSSDGGCDPGGGEFLMRHDRTQFVVEGAGDARVNGHYKSNGSRSWAGSTVHGVQVYDGAPVYIQTCPDRTSECDPFALVHEVIGQFGFWRIVPADTIHHKHVDVDHAVYSACSEEQYPPANGWRPLGGAGGAGSGPAPAIRSVVSSMYAGLEDHAHLRAGAPAYKAATSYNYILLVMIGALLWALVLLVSGVRLKSAADA